MQGRWTEKESGNKLKHPEHWWRFSCVDAQKKPKPLQERPDETEGEPQGDPQSRTVGVCVKGCFKIDGRGWESL